MAKEHRTLLLNSTYEPLRVISWQRAVILWFEGKVEVVEEYSDFNLTSMTFNIKCPAVVRLLAYVNGNRNKVKFSRVNVFSRDKYSCQYCNAQPGSASLTYDHVIPRSKGGKTVWENIVTCCVSCNSKKADRTPAEARMTLRNKPVKPDWNPRTKLIICLPATPDQWRDYLYWNSELENDNI
ncbi:MAG: HNH endonuclease [Bacteroidetes bacterium]|nr:HNH endonuclease [Bacteroidota bacterium]